MIKSNAQNNNPDIAVDDESGDIFIRKSDGTYSEDSIGNIHQYTDQVQAERNKNKREKEEKEDGEE